MASILDYLGGEEGIQKLLANTEESTAAKKQLLQDRLNEIEPSTSAKVGAGISDLANTFLQIRGRGRATNNLANLTEKSKKEKQDLQNKLLQLEGANNLGTLGKLSDIMYKDALSKKAANDGNKQLEAEQRRIDRENRAYYKKVKSAYTREKGKVATDIKGVLDKLLANEESIDDKSVLKLNPFASDRLTTDDLSNESVRNKLKEEAVKYLYKKGKYKTTLGGKLADEAIVDIVDEYVNARTQGKKVNIDDVANRYMKETRGDLVDELASLSEYAPTTQRKSSTKSVKATAMNDTPKQQTQGTKKRFVWNPATGKMEAK